MIKYNDHFLFPQKVIRANVSGLFNADEINAMITGIDNEIAAGNYYQEPYNIPKFQTYSDIFQLPEFFKLRNTFVEASMCYAHKTPTMFRFPASLIVLNAFAWGYKSNLTLSMGQQRGPYHNHTPSTLSGIFYLKLPSDDNNCGTAFYSPNQSLASMQDEYIMNPVELSWVIFPSWMYHSTVMTMSQQYRYIVAADISLGHDPDLDRAAK